MNQLRLNNGVNMPIRGFGIFQTTNPNICEQSGYQALRTGCSLIDSAVSYSNEEAVGSAIKKSGTAGDELCIKTKPRVQDAGYGNTKKACEKSLNRLQGDCLDISLIDQPFGDRYGSWQAMEELYQAAKTRAIGVSTFQPDRLLDLILHNTVIPVVNQIETHSYCRQRETQQFLRESNIQIEGRNNIFKHAVRGSRAQKYRKPLAQSIVRWLIQRNVVVIQKSVHPERIIENVTVFDYALSEEDMGAIETLDMKHSAFFDHRVPETLTFISGIRLDI
ncbi:MAG: aldo/keto reductase [Treponema sp.]|jgi:diketogulonate reductase-like aldo/keto reductase|nr:aldo/keto reductase [Treponema sp.]